MTYSLDSNVGLKWVLNEPDSPKAVRLRDDFRNGVHDLIAPDVFPVEVAHAIGRAERRGIIRVGDGSQKLADVFAFMPNLHPYLPFLPRAFALASGFQAALIETGSPSNAIVLRTGADTILSWLSEVEERRR